jgi:hypothetical protein
VKTQQSIDSVEHAIATLFNILLISFYILPMPIGTAPPFLSTSTTESFSDSCGKHTNSPFALLLGNFGLLMCRA